jgi:hypothetical protein
MLSHLLVLCAGSPTDDSDFAARRLIHCFDYVGVDQHVAILLTDRSFIAFSFKPRLFLFNLCRERAFVAGGAGAAVLVSGPMTRKAPVGLGRR